VPQTGALIVLDWNRGPLIDDPNNVKKSESRAVGLAGKGPPAPIPLSDDQKSVDYQPPPPPWRMQG
jgi:hypothetical protein